MLVQAKRQDHRREAEEDGDHHRDAIEVALHHSGSCYGRTHAPSEHVGELTTTSAVQQNEEGDEQWADDVQQQPLRSARSSTLFSLPRFDGWTLGAASKERPLTSSNCDLGSDPSSQPQLPHRAPPAAR